jgi:GntR family transcriptional regulator
MSAQVGRPLGNTTSLGRRLQEDLRRRLVGREWRPGEQLPSESEFATTYQVSRVTVRTALKALESQGLVDIRHGAGTFVTDFGSEIRAGLQELRSITETIRELGHEPHMDQHHKSVRRPTAAEARKLAIDPSSQVIDVQRGILADDEAVAFSYDVIPVALMPPAVIDELGSGSMFEVLDNHGILPVRALAELHAVQDADVGWGRHRPRNHLYLLLDQVHYDRSSRALAYSRTYFIEGRFQFVILRTR